MGAFPRTILYLDAFKPYIPTSQTRPDQNQKDKIIMKLVNGDLNADQLKEIPHIDFLDLAVTFCILIDMKDHCNATILIKNEHMNIWKKDTQDLYAHAKETPPLTALEIQ